MKVKLPQGTDICQCPACDEVFNSTYAFDRHRTGEWDARACLTPLEMLDRGMDRNARGRWISQSRQDVTAN